MATAVINVQFRGHARFLQSQIQIRNCRRRAAIIVRAQHEGGWRVFADDHGFGAYAGVDQNLIVGFRALPLNRVGRVGFSHIVAGRSHNGHFPACGKPNYANLGGIHSPFLGARPDDTQRPLDIGKRMLVDFVGGVLFSGEGALEGQYVYRNEQPITYGMSVHAAKVKLDPRTGFFTLLDYVVSHDAGRSLNAMIVEGQVVGGVAEGIGGAMFSEMVYDSDAQLLTGSLADYLVATAPEIPRIRLVHKETRPTTNPLGVRGIGEGGTIPVAATLANALARIINPKKTGHESALFALPLKPQRVFAACRAAGLA